MQHLPIKKFYCNQEVACRFLRTPSKNELLVLTIPGGPCLSGLYLDHFLATLAGKAGLSVNVGIVDLPNHGESVIAESSLPLTYTHCIEMLNTTLSDIKNECGKLVLFGQSFGARVAFDLLATSDVNIDGAILTGFPAEFQMSSGLLKKIGTLDLKTSDEDDFFVSNWAKILTLYTYAPLPKNIFDALSSNLKSSGNEKLLDNVPAIEEMAVKLKSKSVNLPISVIQGDVDGVLPDNNLSRLKSNLPAFAKFYEFSNCGHFPMVEKEEETLKVFSELFSKLV